MKQFIHDIRFTYNSNRIRESILKDYDKEVDYVNIKKTMISYLKKWLVLFNKTHGYDFQFVKYIGNGKMTVAINKQDVKSLFKLIHSEEYTVANQRKLNIYKDYELDEIIYPKDRRYKRYKWHFKLAIAMLVESKKMVKKSKKISFDVSHDLSIKYINYEKRPTN